MPTAEAIAADHGTRLFIGRLYNSRKKSVGGDGSNQHEQLDQIDPIAQKSTAEIIAADHGTSRATVERAGKQAEAIDTNASPELKEAALPCV